MAQQYGTKKQGIAAIAAIGNADIFAAAGAGVRTFVQKVVISLFVHHNTGVLSIDNGTTTYWKIICKDGNGVSWTLDFGEEGLDIGVAKALRLVDATNDVSAIATAIGYTRG